MSKYEELLARVEAATTMTELLVTMDARIEAYQNGELTNDEDLALIEAAKKRMES